MERLEGLFMSDRIIYLRERIGLRLAQDASGERPLTSARRAKYRQWLAAASDEGEIHLVEGSDWDQALRNGDLSWKAIESFVVQHHGAVWWSRHLFIGHYASLVNVEALGFRKLAAVMILYGKLGSTDKEALISRSLVICCARDIDSSVALTQIFELLQRQPCEAISIQSYDESFCLPADAVERFVSDTPCAYLQLENARFSEAQGRSLAHSSPMLLLVSCQLEDAGRSILSAVQTKDRPTRLGFQSSEIDSEALSDALTKSTTLKFLAVNQLPNLDLSLFTEGLRQNQGLETLEIYADTSTSIQPVIWFDVMLSLRTHPTIRNLVFGSCPDQPHQPDQPGPTDAERARLSRAAVDMLNSNKTIQEFALPIDGINQQLWQNDGVPRLERNICLVRAKALAAEPDQPLQRRLVGGALVHEKVRGNATAMWIMVSTFHSIVSDQYEITKDRLATGPVSRRTRASKKRLRDW